MVSKVIGYRLTCTAPHPPRCPGAVGLPTADPESQHLRCGPRARPRTTIYCSTPYVVNGSLSWRCALELHTRSQTGSRCILPFCVPLVSVPALLDSYLPHLCFPFPLHPPPNPQLLPQPTHNYIRNHIHNCIHDCIHNPIHNQQPTSHERPSLTAAAWYRPAGQPLGRAMSLPRSDPLAVSYHQPVGVRPCEDVSYSTVSQAKPVLQAVVALTAATSRAAAGSQRQTAARHCFPLSVSASLPIKLTLA